MRTPQRSINSGFHARSTAGEVLAGIDLSGRNALVTGGYSGLGLETVRALTSAGAHVTVPARRPEAARAALTAHSAVTIAELDLADLASVRRFAEDLREHHRTFDLIIANAAIMACPHERTSQGWEAQFATNHLGHFALLNLVWPWVNPGARIVVVSSAGHQLSPIRWADPFFDTGYDKWLAYGQAKTANALCAVQLDSLGAPHGVRAFSVHPGGIMTPLQRHLPREEMVAAGWIDENGELGAHFKTVEQGASTQVWAATAPSLDGLGGVYCENCDIAEPTTGSDMSGGVREHATDPEQAQRLWELSARLTGIDVIR